MARHTGPSTQVLMILSFQCSESVLSCLAVPVSALPAAQFLVWASDRYCCCYPAPARRNPYRAASFPELGNKGTWPLMHDGGKGRVELTLEEALRQGLRVHYLKAESDVFESHWERKVYDLVVGQDMSCAHARQWINLLREMNPDAFRDSSIPRLLLRTYRGWDLDSQIPLQGCVLKNRVGCGELPEYLRDRLTFFHLDPFQALAVLLSNPDLRGVCKPYFDPVYCPSSGQRILGGSMSSLTCQRHQEEHPFDAIVLLGVGNDGGKLGGRGALHVVGLNIFNLSDHIRGQDAFNILIGCVPVLKEEDLREEDKARVAQYNILVTQMCMAVILEKLHEASAQRQWMLWPDGKVRPTWVFLGAIPADGKEHLSLAGSHNYACHLCKTLLHQMGFLYEQTLPELRDWEQIRQATANLRPPGTQTARQAYEAEHGIKTNLNPLMYIGADIQGPLQCAYPDVLHVLKLGVFLKFFKGCYHHINDIIARQPEYSQTDARNAAATEKAQDAAWETLSQRLLLMPGNISPYVAKAFQTARAHAKKQRQDSNPIGSGQGFKLPTITGTESWQLMQAMPFVLPRLIRSPPSGEAETGKRRRVRQDQEEPPPDPCADLVAVGLDLLCWAWACMRPFWTPLDIEKHYRTGIDLFRTLGRVLPGDGSRNLWSSPKSHWAVHHLVVSIVFLGSVQNSGSEHIERHILRSKNTKLALNAAFEKTLVGKSREVLVQMTSSGQEAAAIRAATAGNRRSTATSDTEESSDEDDQEESTPEEGAEGASAGGTFIRKKAQRQQDFPFFQAAMLNFQGRDADGNRSTALRVYLHRPMRYLPSNRRTKKDVWMTWADTQDSTSTFLRDLDSLQHLRQAFADFVRFSTGQAVGDWTADAITRLVQPLHTQSTHGGGANAQSVHGRDGKVFRIYGELRFQCKALTGTLEEWDNRKWTAPDGKIRVFPFSWAPLYLRSDGYQGKRTKYLTSLMETLDWDPRDLQLPCVEFLPVNHGAVQDLDITLRENRDKLRVGRVHLLFRCRIQNAQVPDVPGEVVDLAFLEILDRYPADSQSRLTRMDDLFRVFSPAPRKGVGHHAQNFVVVPIRQIVAPAPLVPDFAQPFAHDRDPMKPQGAKAGESRLWYVNRIPTREARSRVHVSVCSV